jgi:cytochrome c peroxidase
MRTRQFSAWTTALAVAAVTYAASLSPVLLRAQGIITEPPPVLQSLKGVAVPEPENLGDYVMDREWAIVLGKALFWDMNVGSDEMQACATCHFNAGADTRIKNQLNPNLTNLAGSPLSETFDATASGGKGGPNYTLKAADFPFHQLSNAFDRDSAVMFSSDDVVSSQGVQETTFLYIYGGKEYAQNAESLFYVGEADHDLHLHTRKVEPRNSPTTINAAFNFRNFWDGRANNVFNGVNPFGNRDPNAQVWITDASGAIVPHRVALKNASAASQAVGPPLSFFEMSAAGRTFSDLGRKLIPKRALAKQRVDETDSMLGPHVFINASTGVQGNGLTYTYRQLIQKAFHPKYWSAGAAKYKAATGSQYVQMEDNFSLFWGVAIMLYEGQLVSDDSRFDRWAIGQTSALTEEEKVGMDVFRNKGRCAQCHKGPEFTSAASNLQRENREGRILERMILADGGVALYDQGFYNLGVTPADNDIGTAGSDPWGNPLSFTQQFLNALAGIPAGDTGIFNVITCNFLINPCFPIASGQRVALDGTFKTPTVRNVELTGPYFHNGGYDTLESVVDFYNRGGNRRLTFAGDNTGRAGVGSNLDADIQPLGLTAVERQALVAFMKALTDERVRWEMAPFDHPAIKIPNGHKGDEYLTQTAGDGTSLDQFITLPAVGAAGRGAKGLPPLQPFTPNP